MEKVFKELVIKEEEKQIRELKEEMKVLRAIITNDLRKSEVVEVEELKIREQLLAGEEVELLDDSLEEKLYYELIEEIKEEAKELFRFVASKDCMDTRYELEELDSIMVDLREYEKFYNEVLDYATKVDLEDEIMEELAGELEGNSDYVIGYDFDKAVMIMCKDYFNTEVNSNEENTEDYEGIRFSGASDNIIDSSNKKEKIKWFVEEVYSHSYRNIVDKGYCVSFESGEEDLEYFVKRTENESEIAEVYKTLSEEDKDRIIDMVLELLFNEFKNKEGYVFEFSMGHFIGILPKNEFEEEVYPYIEEKGVEISDGCYFIRHKGFLFNSDDYYIKTGPFIDYYKKMQECAITIKTWDRIRD